MKRTEVLVLTMFGLGAILLGEQLLLGNLGISAGIAKAETELQPIPVTSEENKEATPVPPAVNPSTPAVSPPSPSNDVPRVIPMPYRTVPSAPTANATTPPLGTSAPNYSPYAASPYLVPPPATATPSNIPPNPAAYPTSPSTYAPPTAPAYAPTPANWEKVRVVCRLNSVPAEILANALKASFKNDPGPVYEYPPSNVVIVPESMGNSLIISGRKSEVEKVQEMVKELDRPAAMVRLEVRITEVDSANVKTADAAPEKATDDGAKGDLHAVSTLEKGTTLVWAEVTTLDNQPAQLSMGREEPRVTGVSRSQMGASNSFTMVNVGTKIQLTPKVRGDNSVAIALNINDSRTGPLEEGAVVAEPKDGNPVRTPGTEHLTAQTTVQLEDGKTVVLGGMNYNRKSGKDRLISITAHIVRTSEAATAKPEQEKK